MSSWVVKVKEKPDNSELGLGPDWLCQWNLLDHVAQVEEPNHNSNDDGDDNNWHAGISNLMGEPVREVWQSDQWLIYRHASTR